jgi:proteasome beta subunit
MFAKDARAESFIGLIKKIRPDLFLFPDAAGMAREKSGLIFESGTTIIAAKYRGGVAIAGDRRSSYGHLIADERTEKVHTVDRFTAIGSAGVSKLCRQMAEILKTELEYYEKIKGREMSFEAKVNRLAYLTGHNLKGLSFGYYAVPILAGFDRKKNIGRIFEFDVIGSPSESEKYASMGSGTASTRGSLPMLYEDGPEQVSQEEVLRRILKVLKTVIVADSGTGIAPERGIWPTIKLIDKDGARDVSEDDLKVIWQSLERRN